MKTIRIFAAVLVLLSILSCQKEEQQVIRNSEIEGLNLITCTFANNDAVTKTTTTDGKTPLWAAGDKIMLYDGSSNTQELTLSASGAASSATGIIDGTDATKFTFVRPSGWTNVYAIYPSSACATSFSATNPEINFAGQDGSFAKANICAATEISGTMSFKNVGAILKFTSKPAKVIYVFAGVGSLEHDYKIKFTGADPSLTKITKENNRMFTLAGTTGPVYIGVPAGEIAAGSTFRYSITGGTEIGTYTTGAANTVEANKIYNLGAMMGTLPGLFTIDGSGNKVQFSKGNLYYDGSAWKFEDNQYDYRTYAGANSCISGTKTDTGTPSDHWGTFGWPTSSTNYGMSTSTTQTDYSGDFENWGENAIANGGNAANLWNTLSSAEWTYLFSKRKVNGGTGDGKSYQRTTLTLSDNTTTVYGMLIAPDGYTGSLSATTSWSDWQTMESAGCVFLPAAGYREGSAVHNVGLRGYSRSSTPDGAYKAYRLSFCETFVKPSYSLSRLYGYSVRLVSAAQ